MRYNIYILSDENVFGWLYLFVSGGYRMIRLLPEVTEVVELLDGD